MATPHVAGVLAQLIEKGTTLYDMEMVNSQSCDDIRSNMICESIDVISDTPIDTTTYLLQIPKNDEKWMCNLQQTHIPTLHPTGPSKSPTVIPSVIPTSTNGPTVYYIPDVLPSFRATNTNSCLLYTSDAADE